MGLVDHLFVDEATEAVYGIARGDLVEGPVQILFGSVALLVAIVGVTSQELHDDLVDDLGDIGVDDARGRDLFGEDLIVDLEFVVAGKGEGIGEHLIDDQPGGEEVGAPVDGLCFGLFRGHI